MSQKVQTHRRVFAKNGEVKRSRWRWIAGLGLAAVVGVIALIVVAIIWLPKSDTLRNSAIAALTRDLDSQVSLDGFDTSLRPTPRIQLQGLVVRHRGRQDVPPLLQIRSLTVDLSYNGWRAHRLDRVHIDGLHIYIPPRPENDPSPLSASADAKGPDHGAPATTSANPTDSADAGKAGGPAGDWFIEHLTASDAVLLIGVRERGIPPRQFRIHQLTMTSVGADRVMSFAAELTNPRPQGEISTSGTFGPWRKDTPSLTPLAGTYRFSHADLATFKGIAGILASDGSFKGVLERIEAEGDTTTPDFRLSVGGNPVPLKTHYHAVIDGTNGNTVLKSVDATLGQTRIAVSGAVVGKPGVDGRTIAIDADIPNGRLEDLLRLTVKGNAPPLTGGIKVKTKIRIPPGDRDVIDKLQLNGEFHIVAARFNSLDIQRKLGDLSRRGRGQPDEESDGGRTVSNVDGPFTMKNTAMTFPRLTFGVPGATIRLSGDYHIRRETLNFLGTLRMQATVSETMTGIKRLLLKPIDPLFKRDGAGTVLPIRITGTRGEPAFGLDVKSALMRRDPS